ncbi:alpha/beta fold hydrolase [Paraburkholderia solisilvae]|uniref:Fluoroacetate dehalogenase n=1 Tax=Paraburkholderia solisilvae TaxID=624376 RepID=A0A6J5E380_9BURK|nr:alpha/beta hydrolase [Paraburkholderia solisilvae]CAB3759535.1 Fluoroacetate dehalogenase [Paraburkholderia solisilvae]
MPMFENFTKTTIKTSGAEIVTVKGGEGPPLLLMHGNPFNHLSWHKIAPRLAKEFTVVCTDLRGYGDSSKPPGGGDHSNYSFRAMAQDQVEVMETLGFTKFYAAGHDRGARVLHRMCLDHSAKVLKAGFMDMLPQHHLLNNVTRQWGKFSWHWFFMVQDYPTPETMMGADPEFFIRRKLSKTDQGTSFFGPEALQDYIRCIRNPEVIHAMCEDYRATFGVDLDMDTADFDAGKRVSTPSLILWGAKGGVGRNHDAAQVWSRYATNIVKTATVPSGHYLQEECPDETYEALSSFFRP